MSGFLFGVFPGCVRRLQREGGLGKERVLLMLVSWHILCVKQLGAQTNEFGLFSNVDDSMPTFAGKSDTWELFKFLQTQMSLTGSGMLGTSAVTAERRDNRGHRAAPRNQFMEGCELSMSFYVRPRLKSFSVPVPSTQLRHFGTLLWYCFSHRFFSNLTEPFSFSLIPACLLQGVQVGGKSLNCWTLWWGR